MEIDILSSENVAVVRTVFSICGKVAVALLAVLCVIAWAAAIYDAIVGWRSWGPKSASGLCWPGAIRMCQRDGEV